MISPSTPKKKGAVYSLEVEVKKDDTLEDALRRFRKKCQRAGLFSELKRRSHYTKPSEERVIAQRKAERREERRLKKQLFSLALDATGDHDGLRSPLDPAAPPLSSSRTRDVS